MPEKSKAYTYAERLEFAREWCITRLMLKPWDNPNRQHLKWLMVQIEELKKGSGEGCL